MKIRVVFIIFYVFLMARSFVHADDQSIANLIPNSNNGIHQQLEGFNLNGYSNTGKKTWQVNGDKADISDDKIKITNVDANFYGKENANLTSKTGTIDKVSGQIHLQDNVVITSDQGTTMTTNSLDWNRNKDLVTTNDTIEIKDEQGVVTGKGLTAHPNLKTASINSDVKAVMNTTKRSKNMKNSKGMQTVTITSDGPMKMDQLNLHASFEDNVVAYEESTGRQLFADKMEVWFDEKNKKIKKVICKGNVEAVQGGSSSYSDEMVYTADNEVLVMKGRPKITFETADTSGGGMFKAASN